MSVLDRLPSNRSLGPSPSRRAWSRPTLTRPTLTRPTLTRQAPSEQLQRAAPVPLALRFSWGTALLVSPGTVLRLFGGVDVGTTPRRVMRVLGARHIAQGAAEWAFGGRAREIGTVVDLLHAATDVGFSVVSPRWRRAALSDTAVTAGFLVLGLTNR
jgi:hypothetical protein